MLMNHYPIKIYNSTTMFKDIFSTNLYIQNLIEKIHIIDICVKKSIISLKPWIGMINSLNCNTTYLYYYKSLNMNLLITTPNVEITNIPTGTINNKLYSSILNNYVYNVEINTISLYSDTAISYIIYFFIGILMLKIIIKLFHFIKIKLNNYNINKALKNIKFKDDYVYKNCTICLEEFELKSNVIILQCDHIYHRKCIFDWINLKNDTKTVKCPNCNRYIYLNNYPDMMESLI